MNARVAFASAFALTLVSTAPAKSDLASFEEAFTATCLQAIPDMSGVRDTLAGAGWKAYVGAGAGEYEIYGNGTSVFVAAVPLSDGPGCTVSDPEVAKLAAEWILELALDKYFPNQWNKGAGFNDQPAWFLRKGKTTTTFYINDGFDGGAAITFQIRK